MMRVEIAAPLAGFVSAAATRMVRSAQRQYGVIFIFNDQNMGCRGRSTAH
jgi:hypothetical protein